MGGSLSKKRLSSVEFATYISELEPKLRQAIGDVEYKMIPYYGKKVDFGDVDFVVRTDAGTIKDGINRVFSPDNMMVNDGIVSFTYDDFQVDLICTRTNYDTSLAYFSYNDIGNLLGRIFHKLGLKFGHEGLLFPLKDQRGGVREEVVVSKDISKILEFIGCSYDRWNAGFQTMEQMFLFVTSSKYFDRAVYEGELSAINKKRDKKRKTFSYFLTWLEIVQPDSKYAFEFRDSRDKYIKVIDDAFGTEIQAKKSTLAVKLEREDRFREKFSGDLLMHLVPLSGKALGNFLAQYKKHMLNLPIETDLDRGNNETFEDLILGMDQSDINKSISNFYIGES